jgi:hypothetical protein
MPQSHIVLTQTYLDQTRLEKLLAKVFFETKEGSNFTLSQLPSNLPSDNKLDEVWTKFLSRGRILTPNLTGKKDFTESLLGFYEIYPQPTLLFLGSLNDYSLPMQEGMLKLLEEPPANLQILLLAQDRINILPTITSRCQFHQLPKSLVVALLDQDLLEKTKTKLPGVANWLKTWLTSPAPAWPDLKNVEREEIDFWLWQVQSYLEEYYKQKPERALAGKLTQALQARQLNRQNLQKKFVLGWLG